MAGVFKALRSYARIKIGPSKDAPKTKFGLSNASLHQLIEVDVTDFIINDEYLAMKNPGEKQQVTFIGEFPVDVDKDGETDITGYRYYMMGEGDGDNESFLQSFEAPNDTTPDYVWFRRTYSDIPQTARDWEEWLGDNKELSGMLNDQFFLMNDIEYEKVFEAPIDFIEVVHQDMGDTNESNTEEESNTCQLFSREVVTDGEPLTEYLMISVECESQLSIYIGLKISLASINFL